MRPLALPVAALALCAACGPLAAQTQPEPPKPAAPPANAPAGGLPEKIPFGVPYGAPIGYDQATTVLAAAEARKRGWPVNIAVVDPHGDLVLFARMDGAQLVSIDVSQRKARTAARWRRETHVFYNSYMAGSAYYGTVDPTLAASPGGIPLIADGKLIGAVGCSGGTGDQNALICQAGVDALKPVGSP